MLALQETKERTGPVSAVQRFIIGPGQGQCDQNGRFFYVLGNKFSFKSRPNILVTFWAIANNTTSI